MMVQVVLAVGGKIPVLVDGGVRRGTDIFKALALGAQAVLVTLRILLIIFSLHSMLPPDIFLVLVFCDY